jgi:hypothetical protein
MKFKCFSDHESKRACIPPRADAVEISYLLRLPHQTAPDGKPVEQPTFNHPDRDTTKFISTRAAFYRDFGLEFRGYQLHYFARWTNTRHPDLSASWTGPFMEYIS